MNLDPDAESPPPLYDSAKAKSPSGATTTSSDDIEGAKVPITIVTGESQHHNCFEWSKLTSTFFYRLPRRRQDDANELHPRRGAWKENCRDTEWLVYTRPWLSIRLCSCAS